MKVVLGVNDSRRVPVDGNYLYIESATGPVSLEVLLSNNTRSVYTLRARDRLRFDLPMEAIEIRNAHTVGNTVEIQHGWGEFTPSDDGATMLVNTAPGNVLAVTYFAAGVGPVNRSGTIAVAATAQQLAPANAARKGWLVQNLSVGDLWVRDDGVAAAAAGGSIKILPGGFYESPSGFVSTAAISIYGATLGQAFTAREY